MITLYKSLTADDRSEVMELRGLSTDAKPTQTFKGFTVGNGSTFYEINTGKLFMFNADAGTWIEQ